MAEACARLCTSGLSPSNQSTISVPTRQWRTLPRPGTFRSRIRAEAGEADDAARISVFNTLPIIMARSLGDYSMGKKRNLAYKTKRGKKKANGKDYQVERSNLTAIVWSWRLTRTWCRLDIAGRRRASNSR